MYQEPDDSFPPQRRRHQRAQHDRSLPWSEVMNRFRSDMAVRYEREAGLNIAHREPTGGHYNHDRWDNSFDNHRIPQPFTRGRALPQDVTHRQVTPQRPPITAASVEPLDDSRIMRGREGLRDERDDLVIIRLERDPLHPSMHYRDTVVLKWEAHRKQGVVVGSSRMGVDSPQLLTKSEGDPSGRVAASHARFLWDLGMITVHDLGTRYGTCVNDELLPKLRRCEVKDGSYVSFGYGKHTADVNNTNLREMRWRVRIEKMPGDGRSQREVERRLGSLSSFVPPRDAESVKTTFFGHASRPFSGTPQVPPHYFFRAPHALEIDLDKTPEAKRFRSPERHSASEDEFLLSSPSQKRVRTESKFIPDSNSRFLPPPSPQFLLTSAVMRESNQTGESATPNFGAESPDLAHPSLHDAATTTERREAATMTERRQAETMTEKREAATITEERGTSPMAESQYEDDESSDGGSDTDDGTKTPVITGRTLTHYVQTSSTSESSTGSSSSEDRSKDSSTDSGRTEVANSNPEQLVTTDELQPYVWGCPDFSQYQPIRSPVLMRAHRPAQQQPSGTNNDGDGLAGEEIEDELEPDLPFAPIKPVRVKFLRVGVEEYTIAGKLAMEETCWRVKYLKRNRDKVLDLVIELDRVSKLEHHRPPDSGQLSLAVLTYSDLLKGVAPECFDPSSADERLRRIVIGLADPDWIPFCRAFTNYNDTFRGKVAGQISNVASILFATD